MKKLALRTASTKKNRGFSLVELIIVIAIMAVLVAVLTPQLLKYVERARERKDAANISAVLRVFELACVDAGANGTTNEWGADSVWARQGGACTYQVDGRVGGINPSLMRVMVDAFGPNNRPGWASNQYQMAEKLTSKKFTGSSRPTFTFYHLDINGNISKIDGNDTGTTGALAVVYTGPSLN